MGTRQRIGVSGMPRMEVMSQWSCSLVTSSVSNPRRTGRIDPSEACRPVSPNRELTIATSGCAGKNRTTTEIMYDRHHVD